MSIFSFLKRDSLSSRWSYVCNGLLWRILFSNCGHLIGEARNPETRQTNFFCLNEKTGDLFWKDKTFEEPWWIGIEDVTGDFIFFHSFIKPDMPQHAGVITCSVSDGRELWNEMRCTFLLAENEKVYVSKESFEDIHYFALDNATGKIIDDLGNDATVINNLRAANNVEARYKDFLYPSLFDASHPAYSSLRSVVDVYVDQSKLKGQIDLLKYDHTAIFCWHEMSSKNISDRPSLQQPIKIFDVNSGKILFSDLMNTNVQLPGVDSFFMKNGMLYYIKNMNEIKALDLPRS